MKEMRAMKTEEIFLDKSKIDWKEFVELQKYREVPKYHMMVSKLVKDKVFSYESEGNYQLTSCGVVVSPRDRLSILFFTDKDDALDYAKIKHKNSLYTVIITKVEKEFDPRKPKGWR